MNRASVLAFTLFLTLFVVLFLTGTAPPAWAPQDGTAPAVESRGRVHESPTEDTSQYWPQWRGPLSTGAAPDADPPTEWSESKNVAWKVEIPGRGHSTPVVWKDRVFLTAAISEGEALEPERRHGDHDNHRMVRRQRFVVLALDRRDGQVLWQRTVHQGVPKEGGHHTASYASASPVTDGKNVYAFFGSYGLYALDGEGKLLWQTDLGDMSTKHGHGEGASPVLHGNTLVVNWDHEGPSFLVALDKRNGKELWRVARDEPSSWATPIVVEHDGRPQVIVSGTQRLRGYDLATGKVIWECGGLSANIVASPVPGDGMVFAGSSYGKQALLAVRLAGAKGDITGSGHLVWSRDRGTPYVPSLLLHRGALYYLRHYQPILTRLDAKTGEDRSGAMRLPGLRNIYASPVAAAGRIYITDQEGTTLVLAEGDRPEVLSVNRLDDRVSASAAIAGEDLFLRGERYLYRLSEKVASAAAPAEASGGAPGGAPGEATDEGAGG